jgi:hypothetical protein
VTETKARMRLLARSGYCFAPQFSILILLPPTPTSVKGFEVSRIDFSTHFD